MSDSQPTDEPFTTDIPEGTIPDGTDMSDILGYPSANRLNEEVDNESVDQEDNETEEDEDREYIVAETDLDEVIDNMGHFQRVLSTEPMAYPSREVVRLSLSELHGPFNDERGFEPIDLEEGEVYYMIATDYVTKLCSWLKEDSSGADNYLDLTVDNSNLITNGHETLIRKNSLATYSQILSKKCWEQLVQWFGGGVSIRIKCIRGGVAPAKLLRVVCGTDNSHFRRFYFNAHESVEAAKEEICEAFGVDPDSTRLHDFFRHKPYARIDKVDGMYLPLQKKQLLHNNLCYLEVKNEHNKFTIKYKKKATYAGAGYSYSAGYTGYYSGFGFSAKDTISGSPRAKGIVGLNNLGNTCYMNSIIQCLSNTSLLKEAFLSKSYESDINLTNVLGYKGDVAKAFYNLMKLMWSGTGSVVRPAGFKKAINDAKTDFRGYQQHDSQEFLSQLLDAIHEDLNRVVNKPITEKVEANRRPDAVVAAESMTTFKMRNDSVVTDLFTGLYKSTVTCPDVNCGNVSVTFDPYMIVPLPLQAGEKAYEVLQIVFVPLSPEIPAFNTQVIAPKHGPFYLLREILKDKLGINQRNSREMEELKQGRYVKQSKNGDVKIALGFAEDDPDVLGHRDILIFNSVASRLGSAPLTNKMPLGDLSKDVTLICFETFDYLSFEYFNFHPNQDWRRQLDYPRMKNPFTHKINEEKQEDETKEEDKKSDGEVEHNTNLARDSIKGFGYPNMESDHEPEEDDIQENNKSEAVIELVEVPDDEKIQIGLPDCPFLLGDVWHGRYNHNTDQQHLRIEVQGVDVMDWASYANYKADVIDKYGDNNPDVQLDEKEFAGRKVFFIHAQADSKEFVGQYMSAFRGRSQTQFELKGVYITKDVNEEEIEIPMAKPITNKVTQEETEDTNDGPIHKNVEISSFEVSEFKPKKYSGSKVEDGKKKSKGMFKRGKSFFGRKNKGKVSQEEEILKEYKTSMNFPTVKSARKVSKAEDIGENLHKIANRLIPGQMEKKYLHGSFVLRPTEKREIYQPPRYGLSNYYNNAFSSTYARQDTSREPIILHGSIENQFRYMWGKFQVDNSFVKGQFTCQRYESMNWNNHEIKDNGTFDQVKNFTRFPCPLNQDNRVLILLCHKIETSGFRTTHAGIPEAFFAPSHITESEVMDMIKARFRIYLENEFNKTGKNAMEIKDTSVEIDVVQRLLQSVVVKRATSRFDINRYTYSYGRSNRINRLAGEELDPHNDRPLHMTSEPFIHLVCEWNDYPFIKTRSEDVFLRESNETKMTLYKALDLFSQTDRLSAMNTWYCNKCKEHQEAYKQLQLWSVPKVLVIQFKRFSQEETRMRADKLEIPVEFPFDIDLSKYTLSSRVAGESLDADIELTNNSLKDYNYELVAVSSHLGGGLGSGHYVACAKNENDGKWYDFNDSSVSQIPDGSVHRIVNPQAYVLFYVRKSAIEARKLVLEQRLRQGEEDIDGTDTAPNGSTRVLLATAVECSDTAEIAPAIEVESDDSAIIPQNSDSN